MLSVRIAEYQVEPIDQSEPKRFSTVREKKLERSKIFFRAIYTDTKKFNPSSRFSKWWLIFFL